MGGVDRVDGRVDGRIVPTVLVSTAFALRIAITVVGITILDFTLVGLFTRLVLEGAGAEAHATTKEGNHLARSQLADRKKSLTHIRLAVEDALAGAHTHAPRLVWIPRERLPAAWSDCSAVGRSVGRSRIVVATVLGRIGAARGAQAVQGTERRQQCAGCARA